MKATVEKHKRAVREKAEKTIKEKTESLQKKLSKEDVDRLVHEPGVHQVELEMQNEELREAQEALETSRRRYADLYEFAPAGYFTFDTSGSILELNQAAAIFLGDEKSNLLKRPFYSFLADRPDYGRFMYGLKDAIKQGPGKAIDIRIRRKGGKIFDGRLQFTFAVEPSMKNECCRAMLIDITERKQMEEALRQTKENYRVLFDKSPLAKWVIDLETFAFLEVNEAAVEHYGYSREEFQGLSVADICIEEEFNQFSLMLEEMFSKGMRIEGQFQAKHRKKNQEIIDVDIRYTEIMYSGRRAVLTAIVDITDRKRADEELKRTVEELERSNRELQQFAYVASHDLQEPLRTVSSYVDLLAMKYKGKIDPAADKYISFIIEGVDRMSELINDLLAFSRVATRGSPFVRMNADEALERALGNLRKSIKESSAVITREAMAEVVADPSQLAQLFQNLIANAIKFRKKGVRPHIHISAERKPAEWVFAVQDNGIGIEPRFYERIFTIFQRLHTKEEYPGTGVGLAICKRIVERHGGRIWVESMPGEGSTFYFTLPVRG